MLAKLILAYVATGLIFVALDAVWLRLAGPALYRPALGDLLADKFRFGPAAAFYLIYVAALTWFAVYYGIQYSQGGSLHGVPWAVMNGAILGLAAYATYDLTNQATLKRWPTEVTLIDLAWGAAASGLTAGLAVLAIIKLGLAANGAGAGAGSGIG